MKAQHAETDVDSSTGTVQVLLLYRYRYLTTGIVSTTCIVELRLTTTRASTYYLTYDNERRAVPATSYESPTSSTTVLYYERTYIFRLI